MLLCCIFCHKHEWCDLKHKIISGKGSIERRRKTIKKLIGWVGVGQKYGLSQPSSIHCNALAEYLPWMFVPSRISGIATFLHYDVVDHTNSSGHTGCYRIPCGLAQIITDNYLMQNQNVLPVIILAVS